MSNLKLELLAPAGNFERLKTAFRFGADAVYAGGKRLSLRAFAGNFSVDELFEAVEYSHALGKKVFLTLNSYLHQDDLTGLSEYIKQLESTGIDALIASDPGVIMIARDSAPDLELHLSTQANTLNSAAASFWASAGISRIILARECSLDDMRKIRQNTPDNVALEAFVHGAMCISYSGRCLLSSYMNGRDGNRGACTQVCRRSFEIREGYSVTGNYDVYPIEEDKSGTYVLNSRDLNLIEHIGDLAEAGISSFKIEGRMKTAYYVATVVNAYRMAIDACLAGEPFDPLLHDELDKIAHRPYCKGFLFEGEDLRESQWEDAKMSAQSHEFVAVALEYDAENNMAKIEQRNKFKLGDTLEILSPGAKSREFSVSQLADMDGQNVTSAPHPQQILWMSCPIPLKYGDILRKRID